MKIVNEHLDWTGKWIPEKKDPFEKTRDYYYKKELTERLLDIIKKYKDKLDSRIIVEIAKDIEKRFTR